MNALLKYAADKLQDADDNREKARTSNLLGNAALAAIPLGAAAGFFGSDEGWLDTSIGTFAGAAAGTAAAAPFVWGSHVAENHYNKKADDAVRSHLNRGGVY